jgi:hypothetical protein
MQSLPLALRMGRVCLEALSLAPLALPQLCLTNIGAEFFGSFPNRRAKTF